MSTHIGVIKKTYPASEYIPSPEVLAARQRARVKDLVICHIAGGPWREAAALAAAKGKKG